MHLRRSIAFLIFVSVLTACGGGGGGSSGGSGGGSGASSASSTSSASSRASSSAAESASSAAVSSVAASSASSLFSISLTPGSATGSVPDLWRPSVMMSWADGSAVSAFQGLPGNFGTVRVTLETLLGDANTLDELRSGLRASLPGLRDIAARGARIIVTVARTPRWIASTTDESPNGSTGFTVRQASPPADTTSWRDIGNEIVNILNVEGGLSSLYYEFWNEPDLNDNWRGTTAQFLACYDAFLVGARQADASARVGGPAVSQWSSPRTGEESLGPMLKVFIAHVAAAGASFSRPADFLSWHSFSMRPNETWVGAASVRSWMSAGITELPQYVSEWNQWRTFPAWNDPPRDDVQGAAYILAALQELGSRGIAGASLATLQDFNAPPAGSAYLGDFGLLTRGPLLYKASFFAHGLLAKLTGQQIGYSLDPLMEDAYGVRVYASRNSAVTRLLIVRHSDDLTGVYSRALWRYGYTDAASLGTDAATLAAYNLHLISLPSSMSASAQTAASYARNVRERARDFPFDNIAMQLAGVSGTSSWKLYAIDSQHGDPGGLYRRLRAAGSSHTDALAQSTAITGAPLIAQGSGTIPSFALEKYSLMLVEYQ